MGAYGWTCAVTCGYDAMLVHFELGFWRILSVEGVGITGEPFRKGRPVAESGLKGKHGLILSGKTQHFYQGNGHLVLSEDLSVSCLCLYLVFCSEWLADRWRPL